MEYDVIVDAIFGIGLSREVGEPFYGIIDSINKAQKPVIAVDIPSGLCAETGKVLGIAIKATATITFGAYKNGQLLGVGPEYSGKLLVKDAGFPDRAFDYAKVKGRVLDEKDLQRLPARKELGNKGTFGKVLIIAGSKNICGAACLSAESAYRTGVGLVKVITHTNTANILKKRLPEALVTTYDDNSTDTEIYDAVHTGLDWCDIVVIGPGMGTDRIARQLVEITMESAECPVIADADALNIMAESQKIIKNRRTKSLIVTPHMGEMSRLTGKKVNDLKASAVESAFAFAKKNKCICIMKDARTVVANFDGSYYINKSGNSGMAKGGSGDVLTGVIAGILMADTADGSRLGIMESAGLAVLLHGLSGDAAAKKKGKYSMIATDMIKCISDIK